MANARQKKRSVANVKFFSCGAPENFCAKVNAQFLERDGNAARL
jgi:hypothetical protein